MKSKIYFLNIFLFLLLSSFTNKDRACEYVGSNIEFITSQTQKALLETNLNKAKFEIYKAINAIEKTRGKLEDCGCSYASKNLFDGLDNLIMATKTSTINGARFLLNRVLENTASSIEALQEHHTHQSKYQKDVLTLNTSKLDNETLVMKMPEVRELRQKIDASLVKFKNSLDDIVKTVDCKEAKEFISGIYNKCEQALLKEKLSEGKKYYNLRTKAIASEALDKLKNCN
tara:strand:+ start:1262 stop:1951 length:690 start_codon:yes stop_codon:yes gene_type:complete